MVVAAPAGFAPPALAHRESNKENSLPVVGKGAPTTRGGLRSRAAAPLSDHVADDPLAKLRAEEENCAALPAAERQARLEKAYKQATKAGLASADAAPVWLKLATVTAERDEEAARKVFKHMKKQRIGVDGADFYLRWAAFEGKQGEREKERDILESAQALGDAIDQRAVQEALEQAAARDEQEHTLMGGLKGLRSALDAAASDEKTEKLERYQLAAETTEKVPQYQLGAAAAAADAFGAVVPPSPVAPPSAAGVDRRSSDESRTSEDSRSTEDDGEVVQMRAVDRARARARARGALPPPLPGATAALAAPAAAPVAAPPRPAPPADTDDTVAVGRRAGEARRAADTDDTIAVPELQLPKTAAAPPPPPRSRRPSRRPSRRRGSPPPNRSALDSAARRSARRPTTMTRRRRRPATLRKTPSLRRRRPPTPRRRLLR